MRVGSTYEIRIWNFWDTTILGLSIWWWCEECLCAHKRTCAWIKTWFTLAQDHCRSLCMCITCMSHRVTAWGPVHTPTAGHLWQRQSSGHWGWVRDFSVNSSVLINYPWPWPWPWLVTLTVTVNPWHWYVQNLSPGTNNWLCPRRQWGLPPQHTRANKSERNHDHLFRPWSFPFWPIWTQIQPSLPHCVLRNQTNCLRYRQSPLGGTTYTGDIEAFHQCSAYWK